MMGVDLMIKGGTIVTVDKKYRVLNDGTVAIDSGRILYVGKEEEARRRYKAREQLTPQEESKYVANAIQLRIQTFL